ncbi:YlxR family protein [uncultured Cellulomonas sp.]|uniref:YlxR family protein n=1 Tax=uncultured Cellulomonas sp. TaxID=189682 RepID=UPI00345B7548
MRTCVGCRGTGNRSDLLRVVATRDGSTESVLVVDTARSMPGRGAWLHPDRRCLELAERRRAFPRSLRVPGPVDLRAVSDHLEESGQEHDLGQVPGREARQLRHGKRV